MNEMDTSQQPQTNSMPAFSAEQIEQSGGGTSKQQTSLPAQVAAATGGEKENLSNLQQDESMVSDDFQVVEMEAGDVAMMGPSLPPPTKTADSQQTTADKSSLLPEAMATSAANKLPGDLEHQFQRQVLTSLNNQQQYPASHLGDSLIEMIINLRNDNQNLVKALETNNEYVKQRLNEFKRIQEETQKREASFALEKAEYEHQNRKLTRQNQVLSERLKSMEAKLKDLKLEVSDTLVAAHSSKASSLRDGEQPQLYPQLADSESFDNSALNRATTMQIDATSGELMHGAPEENELESGSCSESDEDQSESEGQSKPGAPGAEGDATRVGQMSKEELSKRFDANKAQFYSMDDPMKQCDQLEKQLNDIGKRDYEICLLQQQLNIYRQDFRLERMAKLEAKIQIEKLKNDIDKLCLERIQAAETSAKDAGHHSGHRGHRSSRHRLSGRLDPAVAAAESVIGKLGHQLSRRAAKSAAKAAKYAAKQAHKEEKAAVYAAAKVAAAEAHSASYRQRYQQHQPMEASGSSAMEPQPEQYGHHHGHRRHHSHHHPSQRKGIKSEVVNDLYSTAQKAMLTGYKMASTHVNLALDKLSAFEQAQAANLAANQQPPAPSAPPASISATSGTTNNVSASAPLPKGAEFMGAPPSID